MSIAKQLAEPSYQLDGFSFYTDISRPKDYPMHQHPEVEIILTLNDATAIVGWLEDGQVQQQAIAADSLCIIPSYHLHSIRWTALTEYIIIFIHPYLIEKAAKDFISEGPQPMTGQYAIQDLLIHSLAINLRAAFDTDEMIEHLYVDSLIHTLLMHLLKQYMGCQFTSIDGPSVQYQRWLKDVLEFIHHSLDQDLRLSKLASIAKMSESSFCHLFKEYMEISPHQYVMQKRITMAKQLLLQGELPIAEVAIACGFNSQSHLTSYFRQQTGITPRVYQQSQ